MESLWRRYTLNQTRTQMVRRCQKSQNTAIFGLGTVFTRRGSLVQTQPRPPFILLYQDVAMRPFGRRSAAPTWRRLWRRYPVENYRLRHSERSM